MLIRVGSLIFLLLGPMGCLLVFGEIGRRIYHQLGNYIQLDTSIFGESFFLSFIVLAPFALGLLTLIISAIRTKTKSYGNIWVFRIAEFVACALISWLLVDHLGAIIISVLIVTTRAAILERLLNISFRLSVVIAASSAGLVALASLLPTIYVEQHYAIRLVASLVLYRIFMNSGLMQKIAIGLKQ